MTQRVELGPKCVGATQVEQFDFGSLLASGETLSAASTTAVVYAGTDSSPSAIISGAATRSGSVVSQLITAGTAGVIYNLVCAATTSLGQTLELVGRLAVISENS